nr:kelch-like protein 41b [Quercus suber]
MNVPPHEPVCVLRDGLSKSLQNRQFFDFEIKCGPYSFPVHKVIISSHSDYFRVVCTKFKQESRTNWIKLKAIGDDPNNKNDGDEPDCIKLMVEYFYSFEYDFGDAHVEIDADTRRASYLEKWKLQGKCPAAFGRLLMHAAVFATAVKYRVTGLQAMAADNFECAIEEAWNHDEFGDVAFNVFITTHSSVKELRNMVLQTIACHPEILKKPQMESPLQSCAELSYALLLQRLDMPCRYDPSPPVPKKRLRRYGPHRYTRPSGLTAYLDACEPVVEAATSSATEQQTSTCTV